MTEHVKHSSWDDSFPWWGKLFVQTGPILVLCAIAYLGRGDVVAVMREERDARRQDTLMFAKQIEEDRKFDGEMRRLSLDRLNAIERAITTQQSQVIELQKSILDNQVIIRGNQQIMIDLLRVLKDKK